MEILENKDELTYASSIENVDFAIFDWLDKKLNLGCETKEGFKKTPVIWVTPERSFQIKNNKDLREINGALTLPLMTLERTNIQKDVKNNGTFYTNLPFGDNNRHLISKRINQKKTSEFANADFKKQYGIVQFARPKKNEKIVYQFKSMLLPVYATFTYTISIFTQFQQQMNELLQPFLSRTGSTKFFLIERNGYKYEGFIEGSIESKNNVASMEEEERRYISTITIKLLGNLVSDGVNQEDAVIKTYENAVELKIPKESVILAKEEKVPKIPTRPLGGNVGTLTSSNVAIKKVFTIGDAVHDQYVVYHDLATRDLYVSVRENFGPDYSQVQVGVVFNNLNEILIDMGSVIDLNSHVVTIIG
jgi:hypothetical protein